MNASHPLLLSASCGFVASVLWIAFEWRHGVTIIQSLGGM